MVGVAGGGVVEGAGYEGVDMQSFMKELPCEGEDVRAYGGFV